MLHFKLRSLDFAQKILYHLVAGQKIWSETSRVESFILHGKKECIDKIGQEIGILMDSPSGVEGTPTQVLWRIVFLAKKTVRTFAL